METIHDITLDPLLARIRPAVRREHAYRVDAGPGPITIKLNQNESPYDVPPALKQEILDAFMLLPFNRYPSEQPDRLRQALAERLNHPPEGLLIGNGSNELTHTLGLSLIAPGTPVVLPAPMFSLYGMVVRLFDGRLVGVPPRDDLRFDTDALCRAVRETRPALTVLTTPNNPTGLTMPIGDVERVAAETAGFVLVDEAYLEFSDQPSAQTLMATYPNVLLMRTFSKAFGLAGLRLGYLMAHPAVVTELTKARVPFMVDRFAETVALTLLEHPALIREHVDSIIAARRELEAALHELDGVRAVFSQTNFVIFKTPMEPATLVRRLAESGILVRNMGGYPDLQGYVRVNAGTPEENKAFVSALKNELCRQKRP